MTTKKQTKRIRIKERPEGPLGFEDFPYAKLFYYQFYKPGDIAITTGQHWVKDKKSFKEAQNEVLNKRIYEQLGKEKWKFPDLTILGIWNVSTQANDSGHFVKGTEFDKFLNRQIFQYDADPDKSELRKNRTGFESEQIVLKDIHDGPKRVNNWLKQTNQPVENEDEVRKFTPRDYLDERDLTTFDNDFRKPSILKLKQTRVDCIRACGAGKSQTPYLAYYMTYVHFWDGKGQPINITLGPDNGIVRGNAMGMSGHDQAVKNDTLHLIWTSDALSDLDATKRNNVIIVKKQAEIRDAKGNVIEKALKKGEVYRKLLKDNKHRPIMVHCGYSGYYQSGSETCLSFQMRKAKKTFYWAFIDEVHRTLGADWGSWSKIHDDSICFIKHRFMPTATPDELTSAKKDYNKIYGLGIYSDVSFPPLDNVEAFYRGYIRAYKVFQLSFSTDDLPTDIFTKLDEGREPYISIINTRQDLVIPYKYYMELKTYYIFKRLYPNINHTLGVINRINNSRLYKKFIEAVKKPMLLRMFDGNYNDPEYKRLLNIHVLAMTTDVDDNKELRAMADRIGRDYKDSLILHCNLLGEGWNPGNTLTEKDKKYKGFVDSIQFIDNIDSKRRIAQNAGRGVRSPFFKPNCWVITSWLNIDINNSRTSLCGRVSQADNYNKRARKLHDVATALGIPKQFIHDNIVLKTCKPIRKPGGGGGTGPDNIDGDIEIDPFTDHFLEILELGMYRGLFEHYEEIVEYFHAEHEKRDCRYWRPGSQQEQKNILEDLLKKYPEYGYQQIYKVLAGRLQTMDPKLKNKIKIWKRENQKISKERMTKVRDVVMNCAKKQFAAGHRYSWYLGELSQFDFLKKYVDMTINNDEYTIGFATRHHFNLNEVFKDVDGFDKHNSLTKSLIPNSVYIENQKNVKRSLIKFFSDKIKNGQVDILRRDYNPCPEGGWFAENDGNVSFNGIISDEELNELQLYIFKQTGTKIRALHLDRLDGGCESVLKFTQAEKNIFKEYDRLARNKTIIKEVMPKFEKYMDILIATKNDDWHSLLAWKDNAKNKSGMTEFRTPVIFHKKEWQTILGGKYEHQPKEIVDIFLSKKNAYDEARSDLVARSRKAKYASGELVGTMKGKKNPGASKYHKGRLSPHLGKTWFTDGKNETSAFECPPGYHKGRKFRVESGKKGLCWFNNGEINKQYKLGTEPEGFNRGMIITDA